MVSNYKVNASYEKNIHLLPRKILNAQFTRGQDITVLSQPRTYCPSLSLMDRTMDQNNALVIDGQGSKTVAYPTFRCPHVNAQRQTSRTKATRSAIRERLAAARGITSS